MKFRTEYVARNYGLYLSPAAPVVLLGSCFAENMAARMRRCLWTARNPLGTLYNPLSIERAVRLLLSGSPAEFESTLFKDGRFYRSWLFDSKTSSEYKDDMASMFLDMKDRLSTDLEAGRTLFVTFGTSWCYFLAEKPDFVVANCHKQPASIFTRRRISVAETADCWERLATDLQTLFPGLRIVFTVSPVRHLKDGFAGNARSKAALILAVEEICARLTFCSYFPAYEIVNDDLRDYRFYASDLVHPSAEAVDYLWEIFKATYIDKEGEALLKEGERIVKARLHRPLRSPNVRVSELTGQEEAVRLQAIRTDYDEYRRKNPNALPLEYPFEKEGM